MHLIADIGATNSRCALLDEQGSVVHSANFLNRDYQSLASLLGTFIAGRAVDRAAIAIAAPILDDEVSMVNIDWRFRQSELRTALGLEQLHVLNDFEALASALPYLTDSDCHRIGGGQAREGAPRAVLGPGSGLGVATAVFHGTSWIAVGGEGGHVTLAAQNETEEAVLRDYRDDSGHCSAERLLSGPGLSRIFASVMQLHGKPGTKPEPGAITDLALNGDAVAEQTYQVFFAFLGSVAGNLALTVGAHGGVFIAGGIVPRVIGLLERSSFRERFIGKGRYRDYLDAIPTAVIVAPTPAFIGLRKLLTAA